VFFLDISVFKPLHETDTLVRYYSFKIGNHSQAPLNMSTAIAQILDEAILEIKTLKANVSFLEKERGSLKAEVNRLSVELHTSNEKLAAAVEEISRMDMIRNRNDGALRSLKQQVMRAA
jgi:chromosome segregation ATPase